MSRANTIAKKAHDKYKETHAKARTQNDIAKWAQDATGNYGMAHWETPASSTVFLFALYRFR